MNRSIQKTVSQSQRIALYLSKKLTFKFKMIATDNCDSL
jgi:hypothetical protein